MVKLADLIKITQAGAGRYRVEIDGVEFPWATAGGANVYVEKGDIPGVTITIAANRIELVSEI